MIVGTVVYCAPERLWEITCPPHVMTRLKRVFERISKYDFGTVRLADTPENARELVWFLERFPMDVEPREYLEARAREYDTRQGVLEGILAPDYVPPQFELAIPPRDYQRLAAQLGLTAKNILFADDVGLGKTINAIAMLTNPSTLPALIVTMTHLPLQWEAEIKRFAPKLRTHRLRSGKPYPIEAKRECRGQFPDVLITNYHKLRGWADTLAGRVKLVVFDECQELRRTGTERYAAAQRLSDTAEYSVGLSATPIYNYGDEIYNVMSAIKRDCLGTADEFGREWGVQHVRDATALGTYLRASGLMLRRTRAEVGREIPPVQTAVHEIESDPEELMKITGSAAELAKVILDQSGFSGIAKMRAAEELSYLLRQATGIAKAPFVAEFVRVLLESGEPVVLYGWHREVYSLWLEKLKDFNPVMYTGSESPAQKEAAKQAFVSGKSQLLLISLRAGAGLDGLQHRCRTAVFGELDWSWGVHEQAIGRIARDGQKDPVLAYYLVTDVGSDPIVSDVLGIKRAQALAIRDPGADVVDRQADPERVKKLAQAYLAQIGMKLTAPAADVVTRLSARSAAEQAQAGLPFPDVDP